MREDNSPGRAAHAGAGRAHRRRPAGRLRLRARRGARYAFAQDTLSHDRRPRGQRAHRHRAAPIASPSASASTPKSPTAISAPAAGSARITCYSERTNLYLNYALENERTDNGLRGGAGNLISGMKRRLSDARSMYVEERYQDSGSTVRPDARDGRDPRAERALELRRERRHRHADRRADRRGDRPRSGRRAHGLRLRDRAVLERRRVPARRSASSPTPVSRSAPPGCSGTASSYQLTPGLARGRQVQSRR